MSNFIDKTQQAASIANIFRMSAESLPPKEFEYMQVALKLIASNRELDDLLTDDLKLAIESKDMSELQKKYSALINDFNQKINRIPIAIEDVNPNVDFSSGRHQEVFIDIENCCTTLGEDFYLLAEEIDKLFNINK